MIVQNALSQRTHINLSGIEMVETSQGPLELTSVVSICWAIYPPPIHIKILTEINRNIHQYFFQMATLGCWDNWAIKS